MFEESAGMESEVAWQPDQAPAVSLKAISSHRALPVLDEEQVLYVLAEITVEPTQPQGRHPLNLCLVLDRSTSMQGARLQRVKEATHYIIDSLSEQDVFSVVTFGDRAEVLIPAEPLLNKTVAKARVSTIHTTGGTEILKGLSTGLEQIERWRAPGMVSHLILLTDGRTYGGEQECLAQAELARQRQVGISTMGIGQDWNDRLLDEIASRSGGTSTYVDAASKVVLVFRERIRTLTTVFAQNAVMDLHLAEGVQFREAFRVSPYLEQLHLREGGLSVGSLDSERACVLILELLIGRGLQGALRATRLQLRLDMPCANPGQGAGESLSRVRLVRDVELDLVRGLEERGAVPPNIVSALGKLAIFKMQEKMMEDLDQGQIEKASQRLETMATRLLNIGENELAKAALLEAGRLVRIGNLSPEGRKKIRYGTRGLSMLPKEITRG
jgi:Ca-activated chloride channel family protein